MAGEHTADDLPELIGRLERLDDRSEQAQEVFEALEQMGEAAREGLYDLCRRYGNDVESAAYSQGLELLIHLPKDDRTWQYLRLGLDEARTRRMKGLYWAMAGDYGDRRALAYLNGALEEIADLTPGERRDIAESIELCGGEPPAPARPQAAAAGSGATKPPAGKVGRNDPCPCGSGLKYKKCCGK